MNVNLNGFNRKEVTFKASSTVSQGYTVALLSASTVSKAATDKNFTGVCSDLRDKYASVVLSGYVTVAYSGTAPSLGYNKLTADGTGGVQLSDNGRFILVADVDTENLTCGIVL